MGDYTPVTLPGKVYTFPAAASIKGGDILVIGASGVSPITAQANPQTSVIGVACNDTSSGGRVTTIMPGVVHESIADGAITAGDQLVTAANANRQVRTAPAAAVAGAQDMSNTRAIIGIALASAADNAKVRWMQTA